MRAVTAVLGLGGVWGRLPTKNGLRARVWSVNLLLSSDSVRVNEKRKCPVG